MFEKETCEKIIGAVKNPLGLLTLMVLVAEALLYSLAHKATGSDFTLIVIGMVAVIPLVLIVLCVKSGIFVQSGRESNRAEPIYDVFISTPMAAWKDNEAYRKQREEILKIRDLLKTQCKFKRVFYAGVDIADVNKFEAKDISAKDDFLALQQSRYVLFIYPEKLASGALVEVGAAIAYKIPSLFLVPDTKTLPFILQQADEVFDFIKIYEVSGTDEVANLIGQHGCSLFPQGNPG